MVTKKHYEQELNQILMVLEQYLAEDYKYENKYYQEGTVSKIHTRLAQLGAGVQYKNQRLQKEREEFKALITDISHQLKTPLSALKMSYSILTEDSLSQDERQEFIGRMGKQIENLEALTASMLNISRMEAGMVSIKKERGDMRETLIQAVNTVYGKLKEKQAEIDLAAEEGIIFSYDPKWTREAIANILDNAVKYGPEKGKISLRLLKTTFFVRIEIEDEGIGIPKKEYTEIFKRFYRGNSKEIQETEGSGVGLYLARKIIEEQGGNIRAAENKKGRGSRFIIQLPIESLTKT